MRFFLSLFCGATAGLLASTACTSAESGTELEKTPNVLVAAPLVDPVTPDTGNYSATLAAIKAERVKLSKQLAQATSDAEKAAVRQQAREYLMEKLLASILPQWYGTPWDFNGISNVPQQGEIACGYYVSTPVKHVGFKINRFKLAQQYSFNIVQTLCDTDRIQRIGHGQLDRVIDYISSQPNDVYVVGLDNHVGWLAKTDRGVYFIHSNYMGPVAVECEVASESACLASSQNFVFGHFITNDRAIDQWLKQEDIAIQ